MPTAGRLLAIDHVEIESRPGIEPDLRWFYAELAGLQESEPPVDRSNVLRFKSDRLELRISLVDHPGIESTACRVAIEMPSLPAATEALDNRKHPYVWYQGFSYTDRYLSLLDPAGNRVEFRRRWPSTYF